MIRNLVVALLVWGSFLLQTTVFKGLAFAGIVPNLLIIVIASFGFMRGETAGIWIGFFSGLLCDIFFGEVIGFYALIYTCIGFINGKFHRIFYPQDIKLPIALIAISDLSYGMICYILLFLLRGRFDFVFYFRSIIFPEVVYTVLITCVFYPLILAINERLERRERRKKKF